MPDPQTAAALPGTPKQRETITVTLSEPIRREGGDVTTISIRKPRAGELRGLKVEDLFATDINALIAVLPRITSPVIAAHEVEQFEADDLLEVAGAVKGFFMPEALKVAVKAQFGG